jgi:hypothetical protein
MIEETPGFNGGGRGALWKQQGGEFNEFCGEVAVLFFGKAAFGVVDQGLMKEIPLLPGLLNNPLQVFDILGIQGFTDYFKLVHAKGRPGAGLAEGLDFCFTEGTGDLFEMPDKKRKAKKIREVFILVIFRLVFL